MTHPKGASAPFFTPLAGKPDTLLTNAATDYRSEYLADALLQAESAARLEARSAIPVLLCAHILSQQHTDLALKSWFRAWKREPDNPQIQDALLAAWLKHGAHEAVRFLGQAILPQRLRAQNPQPVIDALRSAGSLQAGACWQEDHRIRGALFDLRPAAAAHGTLRLESLDSTQEPTLHTVATDGTLFTIALPHTQPAIWSLLWISGDDNTTAQQLQGCPLVIAPPPTIRSPSTPSVEATDPIIDIVIPVYGDRERTLACIDSILAHRQHNRTPFEIVAINDACPDPELAASLAALAAAGQITLLTNQRNLGFIATTNRGLSLHPQRDAIMLNADTLVHGDWLDRLRQALYRADDIASVAPWSNNGEHSNFPELRSAAPMPNREQLARLDTLAATLHRQGKLRDAAVPTNCGFAMLMKRSVMQQIGLLDAAGYTRGYGEETDWCLRASRAGYRHRLATGAFIAHAGNTSFGYEKILRVRQNNKTLQSRYPSYRTNYLRFLRDDPLTPLRQTLWQAVQDEVTDWAGAAQSATQTIPEPGYSLGAPLPGKHPRIAVWAYSPAEPWADHVLRLARKLAREASEFRLLVFGTPCPALWHSGSVDIIPPGTPEDRRALPDTTLLGLSGSLSVLTPTPLAIPLEQTLLDSQFAPEQWLDDFLSRYRENQTHTG